MSNKSFEARFEVLNDEQKKAVKNIDGPVLVIAGPGSGKTEILSLRVAEIRRETDIPAGAILCLTFTDNASLNMRERLSGLIGVDAYRVQIHTFHSFGVSIINRFPEYFFGGGEFNPADSVTQIETMSEIIKELSYDDPLRSEHPEIGFIYLNPALKAVSNLKREGLTPEEFKKIILHNSLVIEYVNPLLNEVFNDRLSKKDFPKIGKLVENIRKGINKEFPVPHFKPLNDTMADSLLIALNESEELDKTAPLSAWKSKWTEVSFDKKRILKDTERLSRMQSLSNVYESYQNSLKFKGYYDFDDMLLETIKAIEKNTSFQMALQEEFQYILVDEFQDTNNAQMRLLRLLTSADVHEGRPNIMAVGDDDQAIYKFQGAEIANIKQFKEMFRDPFIVTLSKNYRSTQEILDLAGGVIEQGQNSLRILMPEIKKKIEAGSKNLPQGEIKYNTFHTNLHEYQFVAKEIKKRIKSGIKPKEIALISRTHQILQDIVPFLRAEGIPVEYEKQQDVFALPYIREILVVAKFINTIANKGENEADNFLPEILSFSWWGIPRKVIWDISIEAKTQNKSWLSVMQASRDEKIKTIASFLVNLGVSAKSEPLERILDLIIGSNTLQLPDSEDEDFFENITTGSVELEGFQSPFRQYYFGKKITEHKGEYISFLSGLRVFIQTLREYKLGKVLKISDLVEMVSVYEKNKMQILDTSPFITDLNAVHLLTSHKAKGLEFEVVFVLSAVDDIWTGGSRGDILPFPKNLQIKPAGDNSDDILRLFYVAITRAKHTLYITSFKQNSKGKLVLPVEFLSHIQPELIDISQDQTGENSPLIEGFSLLSKPPFETNERAMLEKIVENYQMSVTHLNNFLDVSKGGPQVFLEQNLLRFPQAKSISGVYGSAMHSVLQRIYTYLRSEGKILEVSKALEFFNKQLVVGHLSSNDFRVQYERGEKALKLYYIERKDRFKPEYKIETDFRHQGVVLEEGSLQARITGKIDKMVISGNEIVVTDFKTGKAKISWEEKSADGGIQMNNYKRQLIFYKLLVENSKEFKNYKVNQGVLEFLEPYKDALIDLPLDIEKEDVLRLAKLIQIVYQKVINLDFPDVTKYSPTLDGCIEFENDLLK